MHTIQTYTKTIQNAQQCTYTKIHTNAQNTKTQNTIQNAQTYVHIQNSLQNSLQKTNSLQKNVLENFKTNLIKIIGIAVFC